MASFVPLQKQTDGSFKPLGQATIASKVFTDKVGGETLEEVLVKKITLMNQPISNFMLNRTSGYYECTFTNENVKPTSHVTIELSDIASYDISVECGLLPVSTEGNGTITMYATEMPSGPMNMDITIIN